MSSVSGSAAVSVRPLVAETPISSATQVAEVGVVSTPVLNTALLQLIPAMTSTETNNQLEEIRNVLQQHGLDTSDKDYSVSKLSATLTQLKAVINKAGEADADNVADMISVQKQLVAKKVKILEAVKSNLTLDRQKNSFSENQLKATMQTSRQPIVEAAKARTGDNEISAHTSYSKLWAVMSDSIKNIRTNYVDFYSNLMQKYTEMYEGYNDTVQKACAGAVTAGKDGNTLTFNWKSMNDGWSSCNNLMDKIDTGSVPNWSNMNSEQRASMTATLEPAFTVDQSNGKINFNLTQYHAQPNFPGYPTIAHADKNTISVSTSTYQAWLASFNAVGTGFQSNMQSFAQRYTQANSTFDNLNKVLSGAISSMADSAKDVLKALG